VTIQTDRDGNEPDDFAPFRWELNLEVVRSERRRMEEGKYTSHLYGEMVVVVVSVCGDVLREQAAGPRS